MTVLCQRKGCLSAGAHGGSAQVAWRRFTLRAAGAGQVLGKPIANCQLIHQKLAECEAEIYASECTMRVVTARADVGENVLQLKIAKHMLREFHSGAWG